MTATSPVLNPEEARQLQILIDPVLWADTHLNWTPFDYQPELLYGMRDGRRVVMRLGRRLGKCLPGWVDVLDPHTGDLVPIKELYKRGQANIATMTDNLKITRTSTDIIFDNGVKEVFRVKLKSGRQIDATGNHPLYTIDGWKEIDNLKSGDYVAVPRILPFFGKEFIPDYKVTLLAHMIANGNTSSGNLRYTGSNPKIIKEMRSIIRQFGPYILKHYDSSNNPYDYHIVKESGIFGGKEHKIRNFIREVGLWDKLAGDKYIPNVIFRLTKEQIALFLSRLFGNDGWASVANYISPGHRRGQVEVGYCTKSEKLAREVQHLLLRFGIIAKLKYKKAKCNGKRFYAYQITIHRKKDIQVFAKEIGIFGKKEALDKVLNTLDTFDGRDDPVPNIMQKVEESRIRKEISPKQMVAGFGNENTRYRRQYAPQRSTLTHFGQVLGEERFVDLGTSDLYWDRIESIESIGYHRTYDMTVSGTHNFIANDIVTHNSECMALMTLWFAWTQINRNPNRRSEEDRYKILIICPYEEQVDLIFERLQQMVYSSPILSNSVKRNIHHRIELHNGSIIKGMTAGSKTNTGAAGTRGQYADVLILDEVDYMVDSDITNIINIANEDPGRIKIITASTPTGRRGMFYRWCTGKVKGWAHFHKPSTVNKRLMKVNPDTGQTYMDDLKDELTDLRYLQEVMAEFGEEQSGVYAKRYIDLAIELGRHLEIKYYTVNNPLPKSMNPRILGVDWDIVQATPNLYGLEFNSDIGIFVPIYRKEIPRHEFSLTKAVGEIIASDEAFNWDWIMVDRGMGEMQVETLRLHGINNNNPDFARKVIGVSFSQKVKVRDPLSKKIEKKPVKPFMVNYSVNQFEKGRIAIVPNDKKFIEQLEEYRIKSISPHGMPTYTDDNEHILDAMNLCLLGFALKYDKLIKQKASMGLLKVPALNIHDNVQPRGIEDINTKTKLHPLAKSIIKGIRSISLRGRARSNGPPTRSNLGRGFRR